VAIGQGTLRIAPGQHLIAQAIESDRLTIIADKFRVRRRQGPQKKRPLVGSITYSHVTMATGIEIGTDVTRISSTATGGAGTAASG